MPLDLADDTTMITMFRGKRVEDMTREELIEAVKILGRAWQWELDCNARQRLMPINLSAPYGQFQWVARV